MADFLSPLSGPDAVDVVLDLGVPQPDDLVEREHAVPRVLADVNLGQFYNKTIHLLVGLFFGCFVGFLNCFVVVLFDFLIFSTLFYIYLFIACLFDYWFVCIVCSFCFYIVICIFLK